MIDFHSHILPGIDDGAQDPATAVQMLKQAAEQGITTIVATPHFNYDEIDTTVFLEKRRTAAQLLKQAADVEGITTPKVVQGAEVYLMPGTATREDIKKLCIEGTNCLLVEMPIGRWTGWVFNEIYTLRDRDIVPVLAHLERYFADKENTDKIMRLLEMEVCVQVNAEDVLKFRYRKTIKHFARVCEAVVLGSDSHDPVRRPSYMAKAVAVLEKRFGKHFVSEMMNNAETLAFEEYYF